MMLSITEIRSRLHQTNSQKLSPESPYPTEFYEGQPNPAAVLIPLMNKEENWHILFIRRTVVPHDRHSGQVAFPGGRRAPTDLNAEETALREAHEEVGINPADVNILGQVRDIWTITNFCVTPIVGEIPWPYEFIKQNEEVARIFSIPVNWLVDPKNKAAQIQRHRVLGLDIPVVYYQKFDDELLWGATARITLLFLEAIGLASPDRRYS